jgi:hypothetical protein
VAWHSWDTLVEPRLCFWVSVLACALRTWFNSGLLHGLKCLQPATPCYTVSDTRCFVLATAGWPGVLCGSRLLLLLPVVSSFADEVCRALPSSTGFLFHLASLAGCRRRCVCVAGVGIAPFACMRPAMSFFGCTVEAACTVEGCCLWLCLECSPLGQHWVRAGLSLHLYADVYLPDVGDRQGSICEVHGHRTRYAVACCGQT